MIEGLSSFKPEGVTVQSVPVLVMPERTGTTRRHSWRRVTENMLLDFSLLLPSISERSLSCWSILMLACLVGL
jgi:hypothetical protein